MTLSASLDESTLAVEPGGSIRCQARVKNSSARRRQVRLHVAGAAAPWSWVIPPDLVIEAGSEAVASLGFRFPLGGDPPAGPLSFEFVVSPDRAGPALTVGGVVAVAERRELSVELGPPDALDPRSARYRVTLHNRGNVAGRVALRATSPEDRLAIALDPAIVTVELGQRATAMLSVKAPRRLGRGRSTPFVVVATPDHGAALAVHGALHQRPSIPGRTLALGVAVVVLGAMLVLRATVLAPDARPRSVVGASPRTEGSRSTDSSDQAAVFDPACPAKGHIDTKGVTGLNPQDIPTLPPDYSYFRVAGDSCTPKRWNPCAPIPFVINPDLAPGSGVADVREAFVRLGQATGLSFVDEGFTDEAGGGDRAYQPNRYGERWAPILVQWQDQSSRSSGSLQVVGSGFPYSAGDVYVTGTLTLNVGAVTNTVTRAPLAGGFDSPPGVGPIGAGGVRWGRVILHELGHIAGLGHARDPAQLMYPETTKSTIRPTGFGRGDAEGLRRLGTEAGCLASPRLGTPTRV